MPNMCDNIITVHGQTEAIKQLWEDANREDGGLLSAMVPQPENMFRDDLGQSELEECRDKGIPNWLDWNNDNWGTKWDVTVENLEFKDNGDGTGSITGWFYSAWTPPIRAYEKFCELIDGVFLEAYFSEDNMDFAGVWTSEGVNDILENISDLAYEKVNSGESGSELFDRLDEQFYFTENVRMRIEDERLEEQEQG